MNNKRIRINLRMPTELVRWGRTFAKKNEITFTKVVELSVNSFKKKPKLNAR